MDFRVGSTEAGSQNCTLSIRTMFNYNCPHTNTEQVWPNKLWNFSFFKICLLFGTKYNLIFLSRKYKMISSKISFRSFGRNYYYLTPFPSFLPPRIETFVKVKSQFVVCFSLEIPELMSCQKLVSLVRWFCVGWHDQGPDLGQNWLLCVNPWLLLSFFFFLLITNWLLYVNPWLLLSFFKPPHTSLSRLPSIQRMRALVFLRALLAQLELHLVSSSD